MQDTFEDYLGYLNENLERIRSSMFIGEDSPLHELYYGPFRQNFLAKGRPQYDPGLISATDSSEFVRELFNGKKLILIRAFAKTREVTAKDFICEVIDVNRDDIRNFSILLMEHTEHLATLRLLEECTPDFILMDGSLAGRLHHKRSRIDAEGYENFIDLYFAKLYELLGEALKRKIPVVFIAKSSESGIFRRYLLEGMRGGDFPDPAIEEERKQKRTDHLLIKSFAETEGYTAPLLASYDADRKVFGSSFLNIVTFHALPDHNDLPMKVDLVLPEMQGENAKRPYRCSVSEEILDMIFWGYGGLKTYNIWLADVDRDVKFRQKEVEGLYMKTFERMVGVPFYETRGERRARIRI